jgi:hypothetical protein
VDWIRRLLGRSRGRPVLTCYLRENGPIAYGTPLFAPDPRGSASAMLSADLSWFWSVNGSARPARDWTELSRWSLAAFLNDLGAPDGVVPHLIAIAVDVQDSAPGLTGARVAAWIRAFNAAAPGPLHAVVTRPAPGGDMLFVAQQPPEPIRALLHGWGIDRDRAVRRAYARLHGHGLEELIRALD